jgi:hypothetical protein
VKHLHLAVAAYARANSYGGDAQAVGYHL